ncbi:2-dehydropantoate 2-reductase [Bacillus sp. SM2101]|uniref:2-dehydropantoate 2-reductase n=1 Tax=Bacillus sp. SM2101 TaxID=2805366 RepID=UPI001BDF2D52|nr:2-dehydropantoate 2-reductase [Bacillus sp. SM2101]
MQIGVIGAGSIGLLYACYLSIYHQVTIYTRRKDQARQINSKGIQLIKSGVQSTYKVTAKVLDDGLEHEDLIIVTVKEYHLDRVLNTTNQFRNVNALLFLQNGMKHISLFEKLNHEVILVGVVEHGALKINDYTVNHTGVGITKICSFRNGEGVIQSFQKGQHSDFGVLVAEDWYKVLSEKLIVNAVINPLTALYCVENGDLLSNRFFLSRMKNLFIEVTSVMNVNTNNMWERLEHICIQTQNNRSSMLRDIESGRQTEIDAILGYIIAEADKVGKSVPVSTFLYDSIKGKELQRGDSSCHS